MSAKRKIRYTKLINGEKAMIEIADESNLSEYEAFIKSHPKGLFVHSSKWAKVKTMWEWKAVIFRNEQSVIKGTACVLIRKIPFINRSLMYCCRGFVCDENDFDTFDILLEAVLKIGRQHKAFCLKIDPEIEAENSEFKAHLLKKGFTEQNCGCKDFENVQPKFVYCLDYNHLSADELFMTFSSDYRNRIRKAVKKGVSVKVCTQDKLKDFYELMKQTGQRDGFSIRPEAYFQKILEAFGEDARLYMAYYDGRAVSGAIAIRSSCNVMKYQYGASSNANRNLYASYLLQWEMIKWGLECGCRVYDFGGISGDFENKNNPHYGLYRFKHGFGGYAKTFVGEFDLVISKPVYRLYHFMRKAAGGIKK